jgi:hypothetical protein
MATLTPQEIADAASQAAKLTAALEKASNVFGSLSAAAKEVLDLSRKLEKSYKDLAASANLREQGEKKELSYSQQLQKQLEKIKKNQQEQINTTSKIASELNNQLQQQQQYVLSQKAANDNVKQLESAVKRARGANKLALQDQLDVAKENANNIKKQKEATDDLVKGLQTAHQAAEDLKDATEEEVKLLEKAIRKAALKEFVAGFKKGLETLLGFQITLASIVSMLFNADKSTTKLANNLGISRKEAQALRSEYSEFVRNSNDLGLSTERLIEAQTNLSQELGIAVAFSKEELQTFNTLTKVMGVSNAAAAKLNLIAKASGTEYKNIQSNILKGAIAAKNQLNVAISNKDVFEEIGKLSAGILVKFQNSPAALGAAVVQAKKLGLSLEQVDKIGESLLNWESSIENELKAELLTGREINVERARAAALTGDQATLMAEVAAQAGSLEDFTKLNVIAQGALAGAFGLQREEMAEMLMKQELINQYGDEAADLNKEQAEEFKRSGLSLDDYLKKQAAQVALQDQFNNSVEQLKELFVSITQGPFGTLVGMVTSLLTDFRTMYPIVGAIGAILVGQVALGMANFGRSVAAAIPGMINLLGISEAKAIAEITAAEAITFGLATVGILAGVGAIIGAMAAAKSTLSADDMIQPGYGKRILFSPEGSIAFNDKDTIVAGTDLQYGNDVISGPAGSIGNNDGLMAGIRELINVTKQGRVSTIDGQVLAREGNRTFSMYTSQYYS